MQNIRRRLSIYVGKPQNRSLRTLSETRQFSFAPPRTFTTLSATRSPMNSPTVLSVVTPDSTTPDALDSLDFAFYPPHIEPTNDVIRIGEQILAALGQMEQARLHFLGYFKRTKHILDVQETEADESFILETLGIAEDDSFRPYEEGLLSFFDKAHNFQLVFMAAVTTARAAQADPFTPMALCLTTPKLFPILDEFISAVPPFFALYNISRKSTKLVPAYFLDSSPVELACQVLDALCYFFWFLNDETCSLANDIHNIILVEQYLYSNDRDNIPLLQKHLLCDPSPMSNISVIDIMCKQALVAVDKLVHVLASIRSFTQLQLWFQSDIKSQDLIRVFDHFNFNEKVLVHKGCLKLLVHNKAHLPVCIQLVLFLYEDELLLFQYQSHNVFIFFNKIPIAQLKLYAPPVESPISSLKPSSLFQFDVRKRSDKGKEYFSFIGSLKRCVEWFSVFCQLVKQTKPFFLSPTKDKTIKYSGVSLITIVHHENPNQIAVPRVFAKIIHAILTNGIRVPYVCSNDGNLTQVHDLRKRVLAPDFTINPDTPVLVLGTLLKTLLKELRPRLFAERSTVRFSSINLGSNAIQQLTSFLHGLDKAVRPTLEYVFFLFHVITLNRHSNSVSADDIAKNFTPAFVENATPAQQAVISFMIKHYHRVFSDTTLAEKEVFVPRHILNVDAPVAFLTAVNSDIYAIDRSGNYVVYDRDDPSISRSVSRSEGFANLLAVLSYKTTLLFVQTTAVTQINTFTNVTHTASFKPICVAELVGDLLWLVVQKGIILVDPRTLQKIKSVRCSPFRSPHICLGNSVVWITNASDTSLSVYSASSAILLTTISLEFCRTPTTMHFCEASNTLWIGNTLGDIFIFSANDNKMLRLLHTTQTAITLITSVSEYVVVFSEHFRFVYDAHHFLILTVEMNQTQFGTACALPACLDKNLPPRLWISTNVSTILVNSVLSEGQFTSPFNVPLFVETYPPNKTNASKTHSLRVTADLKTSTCVVCGQVINDRKLMCRFCKCCVHQKCSVKFQEGTCESFVA